MMGKIKSILVVGRSDEEVTAGNFFQNKTLSAQVSSAAEKGFYELKEYFDQRYGPDYNLLNGREYDFPYAGISHPYFNTDLYRPGSLLLNGVAYDSVPINYDIVDQQVILEVILQHPGSFFGQTIKVALNTESIDHFKIDGLTFRLMPFPETGSSFFQVVSSGDIGCFLLWKKTLHRSVYSGSTRYTYSKQSREIYLQRKGQLYVVRSRSSFTSLFDETCQQEIKGFLRREKIRFRNASAEKLGDLINFCTGLISSS